MINVAFLFDKSNDWLSPFLPENLKTSEQFKLSVFYEEERIRGYDLVFVLGYTKVLKGDVLSSNKLKFVVHESDLPQGRGFAPVQWQILEGKNEITVCLLEIAEEVDAGNIFGKSTLLLDGSELYGEIRRKQAFVTFELIEKFLEQYPEINFQKQKGMPTFYRRRVPSDSQLNLDRTIREQFNLLRTCNNEAWPAFFEMNGVRYEIRIDKIDGQKI